MGNHNILVNNRCGELAGGDHIRVDESLSIIIKSPSAVLYLWRLDLFVVHLTRNYRGELIQYFYGHLMGRAGVSMKIEFVRIRDDR
jgi:hypothetical protein